MPDLATRARESAPGRAKSLGPDRESKREFKKTPAPRRPPIPARQLAPFRIILIILTSNAGTNFKNFFKTAKKTEIKVKIKQDKDKK